MESKRHPHGGRRIPGPGKKNGRPRKAAQARERYSLTLDPALMALLDVEAKERAISRSDAVNAAVSAWLHLADPGIKPILRPILDKKEEIEEDADIPEPLDPATVALMAEMDNLARDAAGIFSGQQGGTP